jgi:hypothetical protein
LVPTPSSSGSSDITYTYFKKITELNADGDEPLFAEKYHDILVEYGLYKYYQRQLDYGKANYHKSEFDNILSDLIGYYSRGAYKDQNRMKGIWEYYDESNS